MNANDIARFYDAKKVNKGCEACGTNEWEYFEPAKDDLRGYFAFVSRAEDGSDTLGKLYPVTILRCRNCSNLRMHAGVLIQKWLSENPVTKG